MKKFRLITKTLLVAAMLLGGGNCAWGQTTWTFKNNTTVWGAEGIELKSGNQYDNNANAVTTGGVTFTGTQGFVSTALGIGFYTTGSTTDENISVVVPAGYKATVTIYTSGNRTVKAHFGDTEDQTYNANWAASTKEFNNANGTSDVTLYLYCNQNAGGDNQKQAPFVQEITLTDMSSVSSYPWSANAVTTINNVKTTLKTYNSVSDVDEGSQYTIVVDKVIEKDGVYYGLADNQFASNIYGITFTMGNTAGFHEFTYEKIDNAVFFGEIENIYSTGKNANKTNESSVLSNGGGYSAMSSNGGYVTVKFNVPSDGIYNLALGMNNTNGTNRGFNYAIDDDAVSQTITVNRNSAFVQMINNKALTTGEHTLTMNITYSLTPVFDYLLITKLIDGSDVVDINNVFVGAFDFSTGFMGDHTDMTISQGQTIKVNFKNHGNGESNWFNWLLRLSGTTGVDHTLRADNFVIGDPESTVSTRSITEDGAAFDNWTNFLAEMQDASVEMTISYTAAGMFSVTATSTGANHTYVDNFAYNDAKSGNIDLELGVEKAWLEILSVENTAVSATIAASGYTTLSSAYGLDFTNVDGLTAYVVSNITKDAVTISPVEEMPANTGIVLKGTASTTYSIPVKADAAFSGTNKLQAAVTATVVADGSAYILKSGQFCLLTGAATEADRTIPAGKAYLLATDVPNEARTLGFVFDDELTGINNVNVNNNVNGEFYDLQGRRVAAPQKGLYIMNGRKVIVK